MRSSAALLVVGAVLGVTLAGAFAAENYLPDDKLVTQVEKRVHELQPTRDDRKLDLIGWAPDILAAEQLARTANRPIFLFVENGEKVGITRHGNQLDK
jgi:hypothetical protein